MSETIPEGVLAIIRYGEQARAEAKRRVAMAAEAKRQKEAQAAAARWSELVTTAEDDEELGPLMPFLAVGQAELMQPESTGFCLRLAIPGLAPVMNYWRRWENAGWQRDGNRARWSVVPHVLRYGRDGEPDRVEEDGHWLHSDTLPEALIIAREWEGRRAELEEQAARSNAVAVEDRKRWEEQAARRTADLAERKAAGPPPLVLTDAERSLVLALRALAAENRPE